MSAVTRRRLPRGYLLLEVTVGGAMAAVIIAGVLTIVSDVRVKGIQAARDVTASQLVLERIEERRALGFAGAAAMTENPVAAVTGRYVRTTTVVDCTETVPAPGANLPCKDITVTVTFGAPARRSQATARVYQ